MKIAKPIIIVILFLTCAFFLVFYLTVKVNPPSVNLSDTTNITRTVSRDSVYYSGNNWLKKNEYGMWEMYVEGPAFERGYINGLLSKEHVVKQEEIFISRLDKMLPGKIYQKFLLMVIGWFNRDLDEAVPLEYQKEIYGVSLSASEKFSFIAPNYQRILNYHAAHDIGHAMQNMNLVACTSVGLWGKRTEDSSILIGRNFDFYMGEDFAREKIILFVNPDSGYKFMSVTWGGFIGVVSGMNEKGVTVTLNASKSGLPSGAATPVSIIGRQILQYAGNINQAYKIASSYQSFVSESFMIGSKEDNKVAIIEKTPEKTTLFLPTENMITCSNHFQGKDWNNDSLNVSNIRENPTEPRRQRLLELVEPEQNITPVEIAEILRNRFGRNGKDIGMGNEEALNQFVAHHSIIFNPTKGLAWISANPYQLGAYVCYDLGKVFAEKGLKENKVIFEKNLVIPLDSFIYSEEFKELQFFKQTTEKIREIIWNDGKESLSDKDLNHYSKSNPQYYFAWMMLGDYYKSKKLYAQAISQYKLALNLNIPRQNDIVALNDRIKECQEKSNN